MRRLVTIAAVIALLSSCHHDEPKERTVFTFTIDPLYDPASGHDIWIVVRDDDDGELIGSQKVDVGGTVTFQSKKTFATDKIAVTVFNGQQTSGVANVYTGITAGSDWTMTFVENSPGLVGQTQGTFDLNVTNVPSLYEFAVSDKFGYSPSSYSYVGTTFAGDNVALREGATSQLITLSTPEGPPKYKQLSGVADQSTVDIDFSAFNDFDKVINLTFPSTSASVFVSGYETTVGSREQFVLFDNTHFGGPLPFVNALGLGFLNQYPNYKVELTVGDFQYLSSGPAPTSITVTTSDGFAETSSLPMLAYVVLTSKNYTYKYAEYSSNSKASNVVVRYYSQKNGSSHHEPLTQELMDTYSLTLDAFLFGGTHFILDDAYGDFIIRNFDPKHDKTKPYTISTVTTLN